MKRRNKFKNKDQLQLNFQAGIGSFQQKEKRLNSLVELRETNKTLANEIAQFVEVDKAGLNDKALSAESFKFKAIQKTQSKDLSKKSSESKLKVSACGSKPPQAVFFDNLISVKTVAERLGLAPKTIHNWVYLRKIPYVKCGHKVMFRPKSLKAWLNRKEIKSWQ